jgi:heme O synthase-like polyprenyltransferase
MRLDDSEMASIDCTTPSTASWLWWATEEASSDSRAPLLAEAELGGLVIIWIPIHFSNYELTKIKDYQAAWDPLKPLASLSNSKLNQALVVISKKIAEEMNR